jgi:hypothetical protein
METEENHDSFQSGRLVFLPSTFSLEPIFSVIAHHDFQRSRPGGGVLIFFLGDPD